jgi:carbon-monoxide dehydrogenase small subunit
MSRTLHPCRLTVNGEPIDVRIEAGETLLEVLRHRLALTGTKYNCEQGECGACTVLLDGVAVDACLVLALSAAGSEVTTVEGLSAEGGLNPLQQAFVECDAAQCGYCTPGMLVSATALLSQDPAPSEHEIMRALEGNYCRCTGYERIVLAVERAAERTSTETSG